MDSKTVFDKAPDGREWMVQGWTPDEIALRWRFT